MSLVNRLSKEIIDRVTLIEKEYNYITVAHYEDEIKRLKEELEESERDNRRLNEELDNSEEENKNFCDMTEGRFRRLNEELERVKHDNGMLNEALDDDSEAESIVEEKFCDMIEERFLDGFVEIYETDSRVVTEICNNIIDPSGTFLAKIKERVANE